MELDLAKIELNQDDLNTIHSIIFDALDKEDLTNEQIIEYWKWLPNDIKIDALKWGVTDTVVRGKMYVWFKQNCN